MGVKLARTAGFCWGVRRAVNMALEIARKHRGETIYTLGPLIHNNQAIDLLESRGVKATAGLDDVLAREDLPGATVIIRAHGVAPGVKQALEERGARVADATCPHVSRAQQIVALCAGQGRHVIIFGDRGHAEVTALLAYAHGRGFLVETIEDLDRLPREISDWSVVSQTTQDQRLYQQIADEIRRRWPGTQVYQTICGATQARQNEVIEMARRGVDAIVVVGARHSGNTRRLVKIARSTGTPTIFVQNTDDLNCTEMQKYKNVGVTAGASTPNWVIQSVVERIGEIQRRCVPAPARWIRYAGRMIFQSQAYLALGAAAMSYASVRLMAIDPSPGILASYMAIAFFYVWAMHTLNRLIDLPPPRFPVVRHFSFYYRNRPMLTAAACSSVAVGLLVALGLSPVVFGLIGASIVLGIVYSRALLPRALLPGLRWRRLMDIPGSKDIFMALAWTAVTVLVPVLHSGRWRWGPVLMSALFAFVLVLTRSILVDMHDIEGDIVVGHETLPIVIGRRRTAGLVAFGALGVGLILILATVAGWFPPMAYLLLPVAGMICLNLYLQRSQWFGRGVAGEALLDAPFLLAGLLCLAV